MGHRMNRGVLEEFAFYVSTLADGWWVIEDVERLLPWLGRAGAMVERDDDLVSAACWGE
jgi:hypothetical protein